MSSYALIFLYIIRFINPYSIYGSTSNPPIPNAEIKTFTMVTTKIPTTVKLLNEFALHISSCFFTLYRLLSIRPTPTAICKEENSTYNINNSFESIIKRRRQIRRKLLRENPVLSTHCTKRGSRPDTHKSLAKYHSKIILLLIIIEWKVIKIKYVCIKTS